MEKKNQQTQNYKPTTNQPKQPIPPKIKNPTTTRGGEPTKNFLFSHVIYFMQGLSAG